MQRKIITTADGSKTIHLPEWDEQYHSKHGALQEAMHVFIQSGLHHVAKSEKNLSILEIGFGTGLNAYLSLLEAEKLILKIDYVGVEAYPIDRKEIELLHYPKTILNKDKDERFVALHSVDWEKRQNISSCFTILKRKQLFGGIKDVECFDLVYFDAFGARVQPDLWTVEIFKKMYDALKQNGVLVTYSAKGSVRRAMTDVGFKVERLPGPPGKREMLRATKR